MQLASRFGRVNLIHRDRPLTYEELMQYTPSVFGEDRHESRSDRYSYIPTITLLENLRREGFEPSLPACPAYATRDIASNSIGK